MKNLVKLSLIAMLTAATLPAMAAKSEPYTHQGTNAREMLVEQPIHWISVDQLKKELEGKVPMNVSFDIDDTVLFSSPCFYHGQQKYSPGKQDYLKNQDFWNEVNAGCDQYSIPKQIAVDLINMHQERGDQIYFITGRTAGDKDGVTPVLQKAFNIKNMHPVEFMGGRDRTTKYNKTPGIIEHKVTIHYGDSDDDILAAKEAGVRGIRLMRAANSTYQPMPTLGGYGEEVLINSSY
ncbi:acid phosphatase AphA [Aggregatibacter actinomycetemcomitans]|uniref:Class B acid phosphatase n=1 Tax=Aggregatibacter actinomycetemcomitans serotype e str. SC1083 TaxID=907488 RepID=G4AAX8_AGGAC|nr:acid phosphatase AphA [Aggregatibacter actinomycetemcomitans]EGY32629.1 acid phosphatase/phosphotransferase [Aggregatibacter actinomycetemcomitans serotype e str. SC1083]KOE64826.1 acid phosphatase [Aggregatibacter actinomycetemcomitans serotype e str. A160]KOE68939.1 acid phosphatase [Aggregatibacter actinomycetemcomitans serotype e str. SCC393]KYK75441.1 acid phosphatase [Aggregatibacter actinomycetemcomitans serotype e str. SA2876]KYK77576.1 acid phosphatase [Aggregatibacter actinomycete